MAEDDVRKDLSFAQRMRQRLAAQADAVKENAAAAWREKATEIRKAVGPEKAQPVKELERPFERDEEGLDVKRVVWTGHTVENTQEQRSFGVVGLTDSGYYRAARAAIWLRGSLAMRKRAAYRQGRCDKERSGFERPTSECARPADAAGRRACAPDLLHDASADLKPGAYTVHEARDRAAHVPSILDRDGPRSKEEEARMIDALHKELFPNAQAAAAYELEMSANLIAAGDAPQRSHASSAIAADRPQDHGPEKKHRLPNDL